MSRRFDEILEVGGVVLAAALLCSRRLDSGANYDEGVYLASVDALGRPACSTIWSRASRCVASSASSLS